MSRPRDPGRQTTGVTTTARRRRRPKPPRGSSAVITRSPALVGQGGLFVNTEPTGPSVALCEQLVDKVRYQPENRSNPFWPCVSTT